MSRNRFWGGRFAAGPAEAVAEYTQSVSFDRALALHDIAGSTAHARMLGAQGIISPAEAEALVLGLDRIREEIAQDRFVWKQELEDVHMNIESRLTELAGDVGKKLHTGRSRNDQVALSFRLFVTERVREWQTLARALAGVFVERALGHAEDILPGCTHMQPAQPVSLGQHLLAYAWMLRRDVMRMEDCLSRVRVSPLGAGALSGTVYPLDPHAVAREVGFDEIFANSMDAVSDRDFVLEALFCAACGMMHLSRFCEEIVIWANPAFGFVRLPDGYATGSSMMPQKKNPDAAELMRGKVGRVYGSLTGMLTIMKGLPLAYNRDLQEDKEAFLDADATYAASLRIMADMLRGLRFEPQRMRAACAAGFLNATELADYLVGRGIAFREAHHLTGEAVSLAEERGLGLEGLPLEDLRKICGVIEEDVFAVLDYDAAVRRRESAGGTGPSSVRAQIACLREWLG
ncbi:MAG: argininosuccinate lyase [Deltaproteobacteria bacterium]|nr:argininosuccinate lyase [Deltaproteobacteria bacterium]